MSANGALAAEVAAYLRDGVSVNLTGVRTSGRTEVLRRARDRRQVSCAGGRARGDVAGATARADRAWADGAVLGRHRVGIFRRLADDVDLTGREREVVALLAAGRTVARTAADLDLSVRTIEGHVLRACRRVGVDSRERLVQVATTWLGVPVP